jgi:L-histidine N-alpha-methyltransferase
MSANLTSNPPALAPRAAGQMSCADDGRLRVVVCRRLADREALARDVREGLLARQKTLPPKYFYDDRGARLFDAICDLPEYYLTRTEQSLLDTAVGNIVALTAPSDIIEFGSGASRKTRLLLEAAMGTSRHLRYVPLDVSETMLRHAAAALLGDYPRLTVHGLVGDYEEDLEHLPPGKRRLAIFLGSTIGNFDREAAAAFLSNIRRHLTERDAFLLGVDLVKPLEVLEAAYNDRSGVTGEFNRNVLRVINRHLDADFDVTRFAHLAFFNRARSQIEMHLRAEVAHDVHIRALGLEIRFAVGETIHTEISRKFSEAEVHQMLAAAGFAMLRWYTPPNRYFGLALARPA